MEPTQNIFIKTTKKNPIQLTSEQKVLLNRRGNEFFNVGKIKEAQQIFRTTGYSDGLTRVGDYYIKQEQYIEALRFYCLANNKRKSNPMIEALTQTVRMFIEK